MGHLSWCAQVSTVKVPGSAQLKCPGQHGLKCPSRHGILQGAWHESSSGLVPKHAADVSREADAASDIRRDPAERETGGDGGALPSAAAADAATETVLEAMGTYM